METVVVPLRFAQRALVAPLRGQDNYVVFNVVKLRSPEGGVRCPSGAKPKGVFVAPLVRFRPLGETKGVFVAPLVRFRPLLPHPGQSEPKGVKPFVAPSGAKRTEGGCSPFGFAPLGQRTELPLLFLPMPVLDYIFDTFNLNYETVVYKYPRRGYYPS